MRRTMAAAAVLTLVGAACTGGSESSTVPTVDTTSQEPVTLTITGEWTGEECDKWVQIFPAFEDAYPWATVEPICNVNDDKMIKQINAGNAPDVAQSFGVDNVGLFCNSGAWEDLTPYIEGADGIDMSMFPEGALTYTTYDGKQCALPFMTDTYGIYYNTDMFEAAGLTEPPTTTDELQAYAKELTVFNDDGSIAIAGFVPNTTYYCCASNTLNMGYMFGAEWLDADGNAAFASDPGWANMLTWQRDLIADVYGGGDFSTGADRLTQFIAGAGNEWNAQQDLGKGRVAITIDGEWRNAFVPNSLNYGTAPVPMAPGFEDRYGGGTVGGTVLALPKGSPHPAEAWLLLSWLATDTDTLVTVANNINNVPTTNESIASQDLDLPPQFTPFMEIFQNPNSHFRPTTAIGLELSDYIDAFVAKWQAGEANDLAAGLQEAQDQTNDALAQAAI